MAKSADAFRTISEVADWLGIPAHVLRFWESKFTQVKPVKRAGGRRYYRPADMQLLGGIRKLLHNDGLTIKGVQKILREQGVKHVAALSPPLESEAIESEMIVDAVPEQEEARGTVLNFEREKDAEKPVEDAPPSSEVTEESATEQTPDPAVEPSGDPEPEKSSTPEPDPEPEAKPELVDPMPSFLRSPATPAEDAEAVVETDESPAEPEPKPDVMEPPRPTKITTPDDPDDGIPADPAILSALSKLPQPVSRETSVALVAIAARLRTLVRSDENA